MFCYLVLFNEERVFTVIVNYSTNITNFKNTFRGLKQQYHDFVLMEMLFLC